jgi:hypothetical protein
MALAQNAEEKRSANKKLCLLRLAFHLAEKMGQGLG